MTQWYGRRKKTTAKKASDAEVALLERFELLRRATPLISGSAGKVLVVLLARTAMTGAYEDSVSWRELAVETGLNQATIGSTLQELEDAGLISTWRRSARSRTLITIERTTLRIQEGQYGLLAFDDNDLPEKPVLEIVASGYEPCSDL